MVDRVELDFDFTEVNISKTFTLIHMLSRETESEDSYSQSIPAPDKKIPPYLQLFLPLFMVRFPATNAKYSQPFLYLHTITSRVNTPFFATARSAITNPARFKMSSIGSTVTTTTRSANLRAL